jgi:hypothetical protein
VHEFHDEVGLRHFDTELLAQFAPQSLLGRLVACHFSAGEFPAPSHVLSWRTLGDQHPTVAIEERSRDDDQACNAP